MDSIDTILFDWDGTLINTAQLAFEAFQEALCDMGIKVEFELYEKIYSPNWYSMYQALRLPMEKWQETDELWIRHYGQEIPTMVEGGQYVLRELGLRGYCLGIITSGSRSRVWREINALGLTGVFRIVVCNEDVIYKKPHPEGLETAMKRLQRRPEACCYVGDSPDDMEMGKRVNIRTIGILSQYPGSKRLPEAHPDFCFGSVAQLLGHFESLAGTALKSHPIAG
jgi:HAD superfamily hydrolase (TIGR01509 family)